MEDRDYVLGTHDAEIARLGLQHRVWQQHAMRAWRRAGIGAGHTVLDVGAGPGYASIDLADLVGPTGAVIAVERSGQFAAAARAAAQARGMTQITVHEADLLETDLGTSIADASWCRWVLSFASNPSLIIAKLRRALKPGGVAIFHEYVDYRAWRLAPRSAAHEHFVSRVMASWRADGGEPDVALLLPRWLSEHGFSIESLQPHQETPRPTDDFWKWPAAFVHTGTERLVSLGYLTPAEAAATVAAWKTAETQPGAFAVMPTVLEVIARVPA